MEAEGILFGGVDSGLTEINNVYVTLFSALRLISLAWEFIKWPIIRCCFKTGMFHVTVEKHGISSVLICV